MSTSTHERTGAPEYPTPDQRRLFWTTLVAVAVMALMGVAALVFMGFIAFLSWSYPILLPLGLAVLVALVLEPVVAFLERRGFRRSTSTLVVLVLAVILFLSFWSFVFNQTANFVHDLPAKFSEANGAILKQSEGMPALHNWMQKNLPLIQQDVPRYSAEIISRILAPVGSALGFILGFGFVPIYVFYFLADQDHLTKKWKDYVPVRAGRVRTEIIAVLEEIIQSLVSYLRGQVIVAGCNGVLTFIGLTLIGVPNSLVLGVIAGALSIVPFLGIIASIIPALVLAYNSSAGVQTWEWLKPALVIVVFALVQMSESVLVTPRVQSHSTGLHPLVIILGILVWSSLLPGLLGPVVAVPLTCAMVVLLRRYVWQERRKVKAAAG
jgi:predicted PurR-regulated permease PerM